MSCNSRHVSPDALIEAKKVITLQEWLLDINESNFNATVDNFRNSIFLKEREKRALQFFQNIQNAIEIRPRLMHLYIKLVEVLYGDISDDNFNNKVIDIFLAQMPLTEHILSNIGNFIFLRQLISRLKIKIPTLVEKIENLINKHSATKRFHCLLFCVFSPEITKINSEFARKLQNSLREESVTDDGRSVSIYNFQNYIDILKENNWEVFNQCMKQGAYPGSLSFYMKNDDIDEFQTTLASGNYDINGIVEKSVFEPCRFLQQNPKFIQFSGFYGSKKCFKFLLLNGASLDVKDDSQYSLAHFVVAGGDLEIIRLCEQKECNFNGTLHIATRFFRFDIFEWLHITYYNDLTEIDAMLGSILHEAAASNNIRQILYCYDNSFDVNVETTDGSTPLHSAVKNKSFDAVSLLLATDGINPNAKDSHGTTPLHTSALFEEPEMAIELLKSPLVDVNAVNQWGMTALHVAAQDGNFLTVKALLQRSDINVNCKDENSMTPLHYAAQDGEYETVKVLLSKKEVDVHCNDNEGMNPFNYAEQSQSNETIQLFKQFLDQ